ncbi:MAG: hypothetical protein Q8R28_22960, partial [Dehalococcoidia bacterium]|nr:hypothetical protein [Dehalococcoidia bacterium]
METGLLGEIVAAGGPDSLGAHRLELAEDGTQRPRLHGTSHRSWPSGRDESVTRLPNRVIIK